MPRDYSDDDVLVDALLQGDDDAFAWLLDTYDAPLRRLARMYVATDAVAEDVVGDTWVAVIRGLERFERRSSLKTWLFRILMNVARTRGVREHRSVPFSSAANALEEGAGPAVDPSRFLPLDDPQHPGAWAAPPVPWDEKPETTLLAKETLAGIGAAIAALPPAQREVITLRDVEGWSAPEVCNALEISETNQRVLLHRARAKVRQACENLLEDELR
ncbi:MAG: RNA polymerase sigma factor [Acidimicrobiia bacterium]